MMDKLLRAKDVADFLGYSPAYFRKVIRYSSGFPKPIHAKTGKGGHGQPRWKIADLRRWAEQQ
ncbi:helix-turn-helix transcriptional regulator [Methylobacillus sp. Pita2]|uniref:helix-turn-helix transcriptional regulator n=1 Tax=Methylobacillus sp. Pita2 TaxID=3383245 RepID=UPI0038B574E0